MSSDLHGWFAKRPPGRADGHTPLYIEYSNFMSYAQPKMASLTGLSEEPIIHIVTNSGLKSRGLYNLGLVNRYFSTLELPLIYRDVEFLWMGDRLSRSFFQFQETIEKFPERTLLVRSVGISCERYNDTPRSIFFGYNSLINLLVRPYGGGLHHHAHQ